MEVCGNIEKRLSALEAQVLKLVGPKAAADSGLVRFGDLKHGDAFEYGNCYLTKIGYNDEVDNCIALASDGTPGSLHTFTGASHCLDNSQLVRPIEVEIREKVPGEVSVDIIANDACNVFDCCCDNCKFWDNPSHCGRFNYTWTLTATPKLTKITEEAN